MKNVLWIPIDDLYEKNKTKVENKIGLLVFQEFDELFCFSLLLIAPLSMSFEECLAPSIKFDTELKDFILNSLRQQNLKKNLPWK